jgi:hypothetical protein
LYKGTVESGISHYTWNSGDYPNGIYFLNLSSQKENHILKLVKMAF